jgi:hypothetical protein
MVSEVNVHGLSRTISESIKRQVRQECGFGCVICGLAIATYEHIDPPFNDAKEHDPSKMAYLCGSCHHRVTNGLWSKQKVMEARLDPWCIRYHRCHDSFDISVPQPVIWLGPNEIININKILRVDDHVILSIDPPEQPGAPYSISGEFYDDSGNLLFIIDKNEWVGSIDHWDIETVGRTITIRKGPGKIALRITALPPKGIGIERADMFYQHTRVTVNEYQAQFLTADEGGVTLRGRRVVGYGPSIVLFTAHKTGLTIAGNDSGDLAFEGPPNSLPEFVKARAPIGRNSKCPCGSGLKFKRCCEARRDGPPPPGKGPMWTLEGIPFR